MQLRYGVPSVADVCSTRHQRYAEPICQSLTIDHVDPAVSAAFLAVIRPADVEAALALAAELEHDRTLVTQQWPFRLERARYEAERARRQYDQVEPENRLVARELEGRWNEQLRALAGLETEYQREQDRGLTPVTAEERAQLARLVEDLPALWAATETTVRTPPAVPRPSASAGAAAPGARCGCAARAAGITRARPHRSWSVSAPSPSMRATSRSPNV